MKYLHPALQRRRTHHIRSALLEMQLSGATAVQCCTACLPAAEEPAYPVWEMHHLMLVHLCVRLAFRVSLSAAASQLYLPS
jgi:hypothetical protein